MQFIHEDMKSKTYARLLTLFMYNLIHNTGNANLIMIILTPIITYLEVTKSSRSYYL